MRTLILGSLAVAAGSAGSAARGAPPADAAAAAPTPYDIACRIAMPSPASHLYEVEILVVGAREDTLRLQLPVWSPGRYARMDFARNVQEFEATGEQVRVREGWLAGR